VVFDVASTFPIGKQVCVWHGSNSTTDSFIQWKDEPVRTVGVATQVFNLALQLVHRLRQPAPTPPLFPPWTMNCLDSAWPMSDSQAARTIYRGFSSFESHPYPGSRIDCLR
jgi:hypothetical protein